MIVGVYIYNIKSKENSLKTKLKGSIIIGVLIILAPTIVTGRLYYGDAGSLIEISFIIRCISFIIGLLVIYDGLKHNS